MNKGPEVQFKIRIAVIVYAFITAPVCINLVKNKFVILPDHLEKRPETFHEMNRRRRNIAIALRLSLSVALPLLPNFVQRSSRIQTVWALFLSALFSRWLDSTIISSSVFWPKEMLFNIGLFKFCCHFYARNMKSDTYSKEVVHSHRFVYLMYILELIYLMPSIGYL